MRARAATASTGGRLGKPRAAARPARVWAKVAVRFQLGAGAVLSLLLWSACGSQPRPPILARVAEARSAPIAEDAKKWAPQAHAEAMAFEKRALEAFDQGDLEATRLLAEGAIAAYEHAGVLARLARAERRRIEAQASRDASQARLADLHRQHQELSARASAIELRGQVARAALPLPTLGRASEARRRARHRAAGALATQARLLCVSARLLGESAAIDDAMSSLDELEEALAQGGPEERLGRATQLRSQCLALLSAARRAPIEEGANPAPSTAAGVQATREGAEPSAAGAEASPGVAPALVSERAQGASTSGAAATDALLGRFSEAGLEPSRDERGVVISFGALFDGNQRLSASGKKQLQQVLELAAPSEGYPLLVVGHAGRSGQQRAVELELAALARWLEERAQRAVVAVNAGQRQPLAPPGSPGSAEKNSRLELVFVSPRF